MKIRSVELYNFSSFEGLNTFDLSVEEGSKNIILIGGKNGAGKTSLFTAIKLALFGPLTYGYQGVHTHYKTKIRSLINTKAFHAEGVEASVAIVFDLPVGNKVLDYEIKRIWRFEKKVLEETVEVYEDQRLLGPEEQNRFHRMLYGMIPPTLFDLFLFDGEEVGSIFATDSYRQYVRQAIHVLCGLDTFEIIRKHSAHFVAKIDLEKQKELVLLYEEAQSEAEHLIKVKNKLITQLKTTENNLQLAERRLIEVEISYEKSGGLTDDRRIYWEKELEDAQKSKAEAGIRIKDFMEDRMPLYLLKDKNAVIQEQLKYEEQLRMGAYVRDKIQKEDMKRLLKGTERERDQVAEIILRYLSGIFEPEISENVVQGVLFDLSSESTSKIRSLIQMIQGIDVENIFADIRQKKAADRMIRKVGKTLRDAMPEEDRKSYMDEMFRIKDEISRLSNQLREFQSRLEKIDEDLEVAEKKVQKNLERVKEATQDENIYRLSEGLETIMNSIIRKKSAEIRKTLETSVVDNLNVIYRKNNLVTGIEVTEKFEFLLYQNYEYTYEELFRLYNHFQLKEFQMEIGSVSCKKLYTALGIDSVGDLGQALRLVSQQECIMLQKRIDLDRLSKGERQIFALSLYWAIIQLSGRKIPFIIDTPYSRIDTTHRREISEKFFPNISSQVIILSTDEEVTGEYYEIMKPYIAREYLLTNDEVTNKTTVYQGYFEEQK